MSDLVDEVDRYAFDCREIAESGKYPWWSRLAELLAELTRLRKDVADLREAAKPFAKEADAWHDSVPDSHRSLCTEPGKTTALPGSETAFTVGDLRRLAALTGDDTAGN